MRDRIQRGGAGAGLAFVVVVPEIENQPFPTVRIGLDEAGARRWQERALGLLGGRAMLVTHVSRRVRPAFAALGQPILGGLVGRRNWERIFYYGRRSPALDFRNFACGWRIYRVSR